MCSAKELTECPYVSPIKFVNDEYDASTLTNININQKCCNSKKLTEINDHQCCPLRTLKYNERKYNYFERKYHSEDKWQSHCKYAYENRINKTRDRRASEPWRSVTKFSYDRNSFKDKLSRYKSETSQTDKRSNYCKCSQLKKAINPIIKLSQYIDMILQEIEE